MSNELPISPMQARARRVTTLPTIVIESFNELIVENLDDHFANVKQKDVVARIKSKMTTETFDHRWLNIEDVYRQAGWKVVYDKPGYNESYDATFEFTGKK